MEQLGIPTRGLEFDYIKNTGWVTASRIFGSIASYILIILLTRFLGVKGLGQYSFVFAFASFFFLFSDFGLNGLMIRDLARNKDKISTYASNIFNFKMLLLLISFIIFVITSFFVKQELFFVLLIVGLSIFSSNVGGFFVNLLRVDVDGKNIALGLLLERSIALVLGAFVLFSFRSLLLFVVVLFFSQVIKGVFYYIKSRSFNYSFSFDWPFILSLLKKSYPFFLVAVFATVYVRMDTVMLSFMKGDVVAGWYNAAYKLINAINILPTLILTFGFPTFSYLYKTSKKELKIFLQKLIKFSLFIMSFIIVIVFLSAKWILHFVYGITAVQSVISFKILVVAELFAFLSDIIGTLIAAADRQLLFAKIAGIGAFINLLLNFLLIPILSLYGAAIATGITYIFMFVFMFFNLGFLTE